MGESQAAAQIRWHRVAAAILIGIIAAEAAARAAVYVWAQQPYRSLSAYLWSPYGLVRNNPRLTSPSFVINKNGFRDVRDYTREKPANTLRVILLGGSTLYSGLQASVFQVAPETQRVHSDSTISQFLRERLVADPALAGIEVEVINAAVNFNRIVEVSSGYLAEYAHWAPDFVIVAGSSNNFQGWMPHGATERRDWGIMTVHPWRREFERIVNRNDLLSAFENVLRTLAEHSAAVALGSKLIAKAVDSVFARVAAGGHRLGFPRPTAAPVKPASWEEYELYLNEYLGYAAAITAAARQRNQRIAFFWEHYLEHIGHLKPLTPAEQKLYAANAGALSQLGGAFNERGRTRLAEFCQREGIRFLDPGERLLRHPGSVFIDYVHYTAEGNRFMSDYIYDALADEFRNRARELRAARTPG